MLESLGKAIRCGSVASAQPGQVFLGRIESRILIIRVIETWFEGITVALTGAELEPTSCHALEGAQVDQVLDEALIHDAIKSKPWMNKNVFHSLKPLGTLPVAVHSETKTVTTGLLDQPLVLKAVSSHFLKTLVFLALRGISTEALLSFRDAPVHKTMLQAVKPLFPSAFFDHVKYKSIYYIELCRKTNHDQVDDQITHIILSVYIIMMGINNVQHISPQLTLSTLFDIYRGKLTYSVHPDSRIWFMHHLRKDIRRLGLLAFRYAIKYAYDSAVMGESSHSSAELDDILETYRLDWLVTIEPQQALPDDPTQPTLKLDESIVQGVPNIFLFSRKSETSEQMAVRTLCKQDGLMRLGALNGEGVKAIWANLVFELLYLTNDDDERYSIQAHLTILRNLLVQTANPPFGYPLWVSQASIDRVGQIPHRKKPDVGRIRPQEELGRSAQPAFTGKVAPMERISTGWHV